MAVMLEPELEQKGSTLETLLQTPDGKRILTCIQCGTCAGTCPYGEHAVPAPSHYRNVARGQLEKVFTSR